MKYFLILATVFSLFASSCKGRIFNNPFDPDKDERGYEILAIVGIENERVPFDLAFSGDSLWIIQKNSNPISLNYSSGSIIRELLTKTATGIAYDGTNLWIIDKETQELINISIINGEEIRRVKLTEGNFNYLDYNAPYLYTADKLTNSILTIDPDSGSVLSVFKSPSFSINGFCYDGSKFWILDRSETKLYVTDETGALINTFRTPTDTPSGLTSGGDVIWMGDLSGKIIKLRFD